MTARYREAAANDSSPRYRIMIVQDDFLLRMETAADLRQWGYDVVEAFSEAKPAAPCMPIGELPWSCST